MSQILLIEADEALRDRAANGFSRQGLGVLEATRGQDSIFLLRTKRPSIVFFGTCRDLSLAEFADYARKEGNIPVIAARWNDISSMIADVTTCAPVLAGVTFERILKALRDLE